MLVTPYQERLAAAVADQLGDAFTALDTAVAACMVELLGVVVDYLRDAVVHGPPAHLRITDTGDAWRHGVNHAMAAVTSLALDVMCTQPPDR
jgi:hypothetical protein